MGNGLSVVMTVWSRNDGPGRRGDRKRARGASSYLLGQGAGQQDTPIRTDRGRVNTANAGRRLSRAIPVGQRLKVRGVRITRTGDDALRRTGRDEVRLSGHGLRRVRCPDLPRKASRVIVQCPRKRPYESSPFSSAGRRRRDARLATTAINSPGSAGFERYIWKPAARMLTRSSIVAKAVSAAAGRSPHRSVLRARIFLISV